MLDSVSPLSVIAADSPRPDGSVIRQEWSPPLPPLAEDTEEEPSPSLPPPSQHLSINLVEAREFDASLTRLVENDVGNMAPFMVFLLGMPFVGVATQHGCVSSMGYGIKRAIGTVRIDGGKSILYRVKETARALPRCCWDTEKIADEEIEIELPVYGVEYTAYDVENHHREVAR